MDQRTTSLQNSIGIGLNFLLIDQWAEDTSILPTALKQSLLVYDGDVTDVIAQYKSVTDGEVFAWEEIITPISQTTIFVHPTTFERYRFNGTNMEVYDDVDGVVPKWLKYEALLSQTGTDAPVARVLNQDETDYLGDIEWIRESPGLYKSNILFEPNLIAITSAMNIWQHDAIDGSSTDIAEHYNPSTGEFEILTRDGEAMMDDMMISYYVEIKVRQRGSAPVLLSAETNTTGDKIILTFDKKMSGYDLNPNGTNQFSFTGNVGTDSVPYIDALNINCIVIPTDGTFIPTEEILLSTSNYVGVESFDYGLLQPFENFPVVNNVVAV